MDVVLSKDSVDDNGFARNPVWYQMTQTRQAPDPCAFCPCENEDSQQWNAVANCTNQSLHFNSGTFCSGHMNWLPIEYVAETITWAEHSTGLFDDDDYFFYIKRRDQSIRTAAQDDTRDGTEIEFDAGETVGNWDVTHTWWEDFHKAVDSNGGKTGGPAGRMIDGSEAILIGMLGLDTYQHGSHDVHSELHPVYAMFVRLPGPLPSSPDRWAFFVRNWGNEGGCGSDQEPISQNTIRVRLPERGTGRVKLKENVYAYWNDDDNGCSQQTWSYQRIQGGLLLTFSLQDASHQCGFMGDLTIDWGSQSVSVAHAEGPVAAITEARAAELRVVRAPNEDVDPVLKSKIEKLDPAAQKLLYEQIDHLTRQPRTRQKRSTNNAHSIVEPIKTVGTLPRYGAGLKSVPDHSAKKAKRRELIISFLKAHGIN